MSRRVVIIDDSRFIVEKLSTFFIEKMQYNVVATGDDGFSAVELYRKFKPDLITLDITMPRKNGAEALREILAEFPGAIVLIISAVRGDDMLDCLQAGARDYIEKPLHLESAQFVDDMIKTIQSLVPGAM